MPAPGSLHHMTSYDVIGIVLHKIWTDTVKTTSDPGMRISFINLENEGQHNNVSPKLAKANDVPVL